MKKKINEIKLNILKASTYAIWGIISATIVSAIQGGMPLYQAVIYGLAFGIAAGFKNFVKHKFNINLDFIKLVK